MSFENTNSEVAPLHIRKQNVEESPPRGAGYISSTRVEASVGNKTKNMRSFWSDLEKQETVKTPPSPNKSPLFQNRKSPLLSSGSKFADNPFLQGNGGGGSGGGSRPKPVFQNQYIHNHQKKDSIDSAIETVSPGGSPEVELGRKSSLTRNGTFGRLHGPRTINGVVNTSPSKLKKVVTFDHTDQVIQFEAQTPELSSDQSMDEEEDGEEEDREEEEEEEEEDRTSFFENDYSIEQNDIDVPVIEPMQAYPTQIHRPLPQIPHSVSSPALYSNDGQFPSLPAPIPAPTTPNYSKLPLDQRLDVVLNEHKDIESNSPIIPSPQPDTLYPNTSSIDILRDNLNYPSPSVSSVYSDTQDVDLDDEPFSLVRKESLLDNQRKLSTKNHISNVTLQYATEPSAAQVQRSMSQKRRSIVKLLEERSKGRVGIINEIEEEKDKESKEDEELPDLREVEGVEEEVVPVVEGVTEIGVDSVGSEESKDSVAPVAPITSVTSVSPPSPVTPINASPVLTTSTGNEDIHPDKVDSEIDNHVNSPSPDTNSQSPIQQPPIHSPIQPLSTIPQLNVDPLDFTINSNRLSNDSSNSDFYTPRQSETSSASRDSYLLPKENQHEQEGDEDEEEHHQLPDQLNLSDTSSNSTPTPESTNSSPDLRKDDSQNTIHALEQTPNLVDEVASLSISTGQEAEVKVKEEPVDDDYTKIDTPKPLPDVGISPMFGESFVESLLPNTPQTSREGNFEKVIEDDEEEDVEGNVQGNEEIEYPVHEPSHEPTQLRQPHIVKTEPIDDLHPINQPRVRRRSPPSQPLPPVPQLPFIKQEPNNSPVPSLEQPSYDSPESLSYSPIKHSEVNANIYEDLPRWSTDLEGDRFMPSVAEEFASEFSEFLNKSGDITPKGVEVGQISYKNEDVEGVKGINEENIYQSINQEKENQNDYQENNNLHLQQTLSPHPPLPQLSLESHHTPTYNSPEQQEIDDDDYYKDQPDPAESQSIQSSTIRSSSGSKLRPRPSLTPLDVARISRSRSNASQHDKQPIKLEDRHILQEITKVPIPVPQLQLDSDDFHSDRESIFGDLDEEFDKLLHVKKRGYTLRENKDIVIASERRVSSSKRKVSSPVKRITITEPIPETPEVPADYSSTISATPINSNNIIKKPENMPVHERGRLFLRIVSFKNIDLPSIESKKAKFNVTLDNGIHCITTSFMPLKRNCLLDEEFELTVGEELEFILSMKTKWIKQPTVIRKIVPAPIQQQPEVKKNHGISKLFSQKRRVTPQPVSLPPQSVVQEKVRDDNWESIVATDGSFARAYIDFSQYEKEIYGKPATFELPCFNEWAKTSKVKQKPYQIGTLQVQLMFIPRASVNEVLPRSIKESLEELKRAKPLVEPVEIQGYLSQLGGDCKYWRRRFFILNNTTLIAHSESSKKPRATINLAKAIQVIDDKPTLTDPEVKIGKNRRKSAFAQSEAGAPFVDQGFRIQFGNGEVIDFYADNSDEKSDWISGIETSISQGPLSNVWTNLVLKGN